MQKRVPLADSADRLNGESELRASLRWLLTFTRVVVGLTPLAPKRSGDVVGRLSVTDCVVFGGSRLPNVKVARPTGLQAAMVWPRVSRPGLSRPRRELPM